MPRPTLRRLRADQKDLHTHGLPPNYLYPPDGLLNSVPEDLTQLTLLLIGPEGTPYSQGLWRIQLNITEDYPANPPKATFRTRIWHPNVDDSSGDICVDTLKRDWEQRLTLREILLTISCLLINPNPDSALNSTAGHLLQEDYEAFAQHARLMTSIHARISHDLQSAVTAARVRGEAAGILGRDDTNPQPRTDREPVSWSRTEGVAVPEAPTATLPITSSPTLGSSNRIDVDVEETSKENVPSHSSAQALTKGARKMTLLKRPLSDLPIPRESDVETNVHVNSSTAECNIAKILPKRAASTASCHQGGNDQCKDFFNAHNCTSDVPSGFNIWGNGKPADEPEPRAKRACSGENRSNNLERTFAGGGFTTTIASRPDALCTGVLPPAHDVARKCNSIKGIRQSRSKVLKVRVGLRRL
ncbi:MAG: hypothetical protein Q9181_000261 [Wetmoreana brouardii]